MVEEIFFGILIILLGLVFGSFFNVCISRIPRKESVVFPASHCPNCGNNIKYIDNIPLLSFLLLKGRCRSCKKKINWHYPLVEFITPILFLLLFWNNHYQFDVNFFRDIIFISAGIIIFFIDLHHQIIPDVITLPLIVIGLGLSLIPGNELEFKAAFLSGIGGFVFFLLSALLISYLLKRESLGGGDIKYVALIGVYTGPAGLLFTVLFSSVLAMIFLVLINHQKGREFPFGPFLAIGSGLYLLAGDRIIDLYLDLAFNYL
ncbi:MAG: prepilin peptidase [Candidatus Cloacimonetes bacterium]|nr:prepilin peptidase [Candidatus Cloacimonadota bacterium]